MPRLSNKKLRQQKNKGSHQRRRTTRGNRFLSKLKKYKWYETENSTNNKRDVIHEFLNSTEEMGEHDFWYKKGG